MMFAALRWETDDVATGMTSAAGELCPVFGSHQATSVGSCEELSDRGLPRVPRKRSFSVRTRFADWVAADATKYFGDSGDKDPVRHRVWSFNRQTKSGEVEVLVPALALMRALLRPHTYVLARMFQPHALDLVCLFIDGAPRPTKPWPRARTSSESQPFVGAMTWMHCFPSARRAANSIYDRAKDGWLDLELPQATVELYVSGVARGQTFLATQLAFSTIEATEESFPFASSTARHFDLRPDTGPSQSLPKLRLQAGDYRMSDPEWCLVAPLVAGPHARRHAPRDVLNAILSVMCGVAPSLSSQLDDSNVRRVYANQLTYWRGNGKLREVTAILEQTRGGVADGSEVRPKPLNARRTVVTDLEACCFGPLQDDEWLVLQPLFGKSRPARNNQVNTTRDVADRIIAALAPGGSWGKSGRYSVGHAAEARHRLLVKDGRWNEIVQALRKLRPQK